jgi:protein-tyrosine phosphatase
MRSSIYWLNLPESWRLAIMPRPRAGDWLADEIVAWKNEGIDLVLSLLEDDEVAELGLSGEQHACQDQGIEFISFPIADRDVPRSTAETERIVRDLSEELFNGKGVAIHCRAGIGRSSLIAACVLVLNGYQANSALDAISKARGLEVPDTEAQRLWVSTFQANVDRS